jgi:large subunit ribosomal protein L29
MKTNKWIEIKSLSPIEINSKLINIQDELFNMKFRNSTSSIKNPLKIREMKRDVARLKTLLKQKQHI